jgi:CheY-like chemotaxis protein
VARIVVVEDDALVAKYLKYVLEQEGHYEVVLTESGNEVMAAARDRSTVALIVDVSLRNTLLDGRYVDGVELSRTVKADPAAASVPIVLATAHTMAGDRERFLRESGADAFVRKPITNSSELLAVIAGFVGRNDHR